MATQTEKLQESYIKTSENIRRDGLATVGDCVRYYSDSLHSKQAMVFASPSKSGPRQSLTWREIFNNSITVAEQLVTLGVERNDYVGLLLRTCPEWLYVTFGALMAGARVACLTYAYKDGSDLLTSLQNLGTCKVLVLDPGAKGEDWDNVKKYIDSTSSPDDKTVQSSAIPSLKYIYGHGFDNVEDESAKVVRKLSDLLIDVETEDDEEVELPEVGEDDLAIVFLTSGTSGAPKLVAHTHKSMVNVRRMMNTEYYSSRYTFFNDHPFGTHFGFPYSVLCGQFRVALSEFEELDDGDDSVSRVIDIITDEGCDLIAGLPSFIADLVIRQSTLPPDWPVQYVLTEGQPLVQALSNAPGKICKKVISGYCMTETGYIAHAYISEKTNFKDNSCGFLVKGNGIELKIVDDQRNIMPVEASGEIWIKGPGLFKEYVNDPAKTRSAITEDSWFKTEDIGHLTEDGELFIDARKPNVIVSGGLDVAPEILETFMQACAGIDNAFIVPVPDAVQQQVLCACVLLDKGSTLTEDEVRNFCEDVYNEKPEMFLVLPKFYLIVDKFPESRMGKVSRHELEVLAYQKFCDKINV